MFVPYVIYGLISIGVFSIEGKVPTSYMWGSFFKGNGVGVLWFLICLLMAELIGGCVMRLCRSTCALGALILFSALLGWLVPLAVEHNVLMIRTVPAALFFWLSGCASRRYFAGKNMEGRGFPFIILTALIVGALFVVQRVDMAGARYGNIILFYLTALAWVGMILLAFARFGWCPRSLTWLGRHSLPLMCLHELIPVSLGVALPIIFDGIDIPKFLFRVVNMALLIGLTAIIGRYLPVLAGKGKIFQWKVA